MRSILAAITGAALLGVTALPPLAAAAPIKCWTNKDGVRECGNVVPPEYAQQGHEELNPRGIVVEERERAKTPEELEAERREAERRAAEAQGLRRQAAEDRVLLDTFSSVDDMILTRDGKIQSLESQIRLTENQIEKLQKNLEDAIATAAEQERQGHKPGPEIERNIDEIREQIARKHAFIDDKRAEQDNVRRQFEADIARFRALKGAGP